MLRKSLRSDTLLSLRAGSALLVFVVGAAASASAAPRVIETQPADGATDVRPGAQTIRIMFSEDMDTRGGYSICGGGENFPEILGKPRWASPRVLTLRVRLKPGHDYVMSINCPSAQNTRSASGAPSESYGLAFSTAAGGATEALSAEENAAALETLRELLRDHYSHLDVRRVDWDAVFAEHQAKLVQAKRATTFARLAGRMLAAAEDPHIWLQVGDRTYGSMRRDVEPNGDFRRVAQAVPQFEQHNDMVSTGRFDDGATYICIATWSGDADQLEPAFAALRDADVSAGVVIDVRFNAGGNEALAQSFAGCFVDEPQVYAKHATRDPSAPGGWTPTFERVLKPNKNQPSYRGRVAVLTGPYVMSSNEAFLTMMRTVKQAKLVGASSYGSSGNPKPYELDNGVTVYLPSWKSMLADGTPIETVGIEPDIVVKTTAADFRKGDPVLAAGREALRR